MYIYIIYNIMSEEQLDAIALIIQENDESGELLDVFIGLVDGKGGGGSEVDLTQIEDDLSSLISSVTTLNDTINNIDNKTTTLNTTINNIDNKTDDIKTKTETINKSSSVILTHDKYKTRVA